MSRRSSLTILSINGTVCGTGRKPYKRNGIPIVSKTENVTMPSHIRTRVNMVNNSCLPLDIEPASLIIFRQTDSVRCAPAIDMRIPNHVTTAFRRRGVCVPRRTAMHYSGTPPRAPTAPQGLPCQPNGNLGAILAAVNVPRGSKPTPVPPANGTAPPALPGRGPASMVSSRPLYSIRPPCPVSRLLRPRCPPAPARLARALPKSLSARRVDLAGAARETRTPTPRRRRTAPSAAGRVPSYTRPVFPP